MSQDIATAFATARGLKLTPGVRRTAERRACALGRLAFMQELLTLSSVVRTKVYESTTHAVPVGQVAAHIWVHAGDEEQLQRIAGQVHQAIEAAAWDKRGLALVAVVHRASWRDRLRARREWREWSREE